jgi:hypothetical protein
VGVEDKYDMLTAYVTEKNGTKLWYKKTFFHLINMFTFNAHVLHWKLGGEMDALLCRQNLNEKDNCQGPSRTGRCTSEIWQKVKQRGSFTSSTDTLASVCSSKTNKQK